MSNATVLGANSRVDGMKFLFRNVEGDRMMQRYKRIFDIVQAATGLPTATLNRLIKFKVVRHEGSKHGSLHSLTLYGDACRVYQRLPWELSGALTEIHLKCWLREAADGAHDAFVDATWKAPAVVNISPIKSKPRKGHPKGTGEKGVRFGSRKSDKHAVAYRRSGEVPGLEARLKDAELRAALGIVETTRLAVQESGREPMDDAASWYALKSVAARAGYTYVLLLLRKMGVNLGEYFTHAGNNPSTVEPDPRFAIDSDEELSMIMAYLK